MVSIMEYFKFFVIGMQLLCAHMEVHHHQVRPYLFDCYIMGVMFKWRETSTYLSTVKYDEGMPYERVMINGMSASNKHRDVWRILEGEKAYDNDDNNDSIEWRVKNERTRKKNKIVKESAYCLKKWSWGVLLRRKVRKWSWCGCSLLGTGQDKVRILINREKAMAVEETGRWVRGRG